MPLRIEQVLLAFGHVLSDLGDAANDFVGGRLVHTALDIHARVDAGHVAGRRDIDVAPHRRIAHFDPGVVERGVLGVERFANRTDALDAQAILRIENGKAVFEDLAVLDERVVDRRSPDTRRQADGDLVNVFERLNTRAVAAATVSSHEIVH